jgi:hypothetical protein
MDLTPWTGQFSFIFWQGPPRARVWCIDGDYTLFLSKGQDLTIPFRHVTLIIINIMP